jgi:hypothetical protein
MHTAPIVVAEVNRRFAGEDANRVVALLEKTELPLVRTTTDASRIQLAILKLADGDIAAAETAAMRASIDWRDVLVAAGMADADWRAVLQQAGFPVP